MRKSDLLEPDRIKGGLKTRYIGSKIIVYKSTSSTNDIAAEYARNPANNGLAVFAEEQTKGRGRASNKWVSPTSDSLLVSIALTNCPLKPELLSLICAVAAAEAIGEEARIKWPNDIIINGKKTAGILLESKNFKTHTAYIIGIGINCHQKKKDFPDELRKIATSLDIETGSFTDRVTLAKRLLSSLEHWVDVAQKNPKKAIDKWQQLSIQLHHRVSLNHNRKKFTGNCIGIDPEKGLIVQLDSGSVRFFPAAHTSVEKINS
jgi:BirA family biotin operon repressor/biotin-[acetyl-CoA-carboxylase] ligase